MIVIYSRKLSQDEYSTSVKVQKCITSTEAIILMVGDLNALSFKHLLRSLHELTELVV
jgi:hypothetical protein